MLRLKNYVAGSWVDAAAGAELPSHDPARGAERARVPCSGPEEVRRAVDAARAAFPAWRRTPPGERIQVLFRLKALLEGAKAALARTITEECGKTLSEAEAELRRGIENVEVACAVPSLMQGSMSEDIAPGIDETMIRQPLGVVAVVAPFNFPAMIPLWFLPYAVACGNTVVFKPSEKVPATADALVRLFESAGLPAGVLNLLHGGRDAVDAILDHPGVRAVSFVGSSPVARHVYARGAAAGKRLQCQGGAKNVAVVLPDADLERSAEILADSAFGCAGQRCLATSLAVIVGDARGPLEDLLVREAARRVVGSGLDPAVKMGPLISAESRARVEGLIASGLREGARAIVDGRGARVPGFEEGYFVRPTILADVPPEGTLARTEVFGPVLGLIRAKTVDDAIDLINRSEFGNQACLFTTSGAAARKFRYEVQAGNVGINLGVAAPVATFPFSGWKGSFFGDLHGQGRDAVEFYTDKKVVIERWPAAWSRTF
jgi:malonate-semialdehyde dehydrogenase (acetylating)/methylmalonate-semialdehyde dehydrogenase